MKNLVYALTIFSFIQSKYHFLKCCAKYALNPTEIIYLTKQQLLDGDWTLSGSGGEKQPLKALEIFLYVKRWLRRVEFDEPEDLKEYRIKNGKPILVNFGYGKPVVTSPAFGLVIAEVVHVEDFYNMDRSVVSEIIVDFLIDKRIEFNDILDFSMEQNTPYLANAIKEQDHQKK